MLVNMWRTLLITVWWQTNVFCSGLNVTDIDAMTDYNGSAVLHKNVPLDTTEELIELGGFYYSSIPQTGIVMEYSEEAPDDFELRLDELEEHSSKEEEQSTFQPWSILWYIGSFGGLIAFFIVVSCSEWCCRNHARNRNLQNLTSSSPTPSEVPPPAYDLFAPPSYESLCRSNEKNEYDVFVVPVHTISSLSDRSLLESDSSAPPAYCTSAVNHQVVVNVATPEEEFREVPKTQSENVRQV